jgi:hypothetical protein
MPAAGEAANQSVIRQLHTPASGPGHWCVRPKNVKKAFYTQARKPFEAASRHFSKVVNWFLNEERKPE